MKEKWKDELGMKERWKEIFCIFATTLLLPCIITLMVSGTESEGKKVSSGISIECENGQIMDMEEFLIYMVAGQINLDYEEEALKAQAVIARTNLLRELGEKKEAKSSELNLVYLSPEKFVQSFGEKKREEAEQKLRKIVSKTYPKVLTYEDAYIEAMYHPVSTGRTVSAEEIFGKGKPYLTEVESSQDVESKEYMTLVTVPAAELLEKIQGTGKGMTLTRDSIMSSLRIAEKTASGYVKTVGIGTETMSGEEWKNLFGLNSTNFYLEEQEGQLRMIVLGKGHGIGLSQYGANVLAMDSHSWEEILEYYYPGIVIRSYQNERR